MAELEQTIKLNIDYGWPTGETPKDGDRVTITIAGKESHYIVRVSEAGIYLDPVVFARN